jgi:DNA-binding NtrC family response regulator
MAKAAHDPRPYRARILVVDADAAVRRGIGEFLQNEGYDVELAACAENAMDCLKASRIDLVLADAGSSARGLTLLADVRKRYEDAVVILVTAEGTIESAVEAVKRGAHDYLVKPLIDDDIRLSVERALRQQRLLCENHQLRRELEGRYSMDRIVGADLRMAKVFDLIEVVADSRTTVLITGESGTGKSLIARAIHGRSQRRQGPFVEVSCGALPDTLLESELFGHVKGAFTHAVADKQGKFAAADGGTIFLDEISSASPQLQVKLLRVLQERQLEPLGSNRTQEVDVRVILASNHNLQAEVEAGRFRSDLYYRINVVNIDLPPLRQRVGDIELLADAFLRKFLDDTPKSIEGFAPQAMELMLRYSWPGNVRELENCVERAVVLCRQNLIGPDDLPPAVLHGARRDGEHEPYTPAMGTLYDALVEPEKHIITSALEANHGNRQATAEQLGINRTTLYKKMKKYGLMK